MPSSFRVVFNKNSSFFLPFLLSNKINASLDNFFSRTFSFSAKPTLSESLILLEMKKGNKKDLFLLITTLKELGVKYSENFYFKYSISLMRHLSTLGWPVGRSLYKQRKIKKELLYA